MIVLWALDVVFTFFVPGGHTPPSSGEDWFGRDLP
jgi:hypothetical protein